MKAVMLVTGASSGFGLLTAQALARAGHTVYASMRESAGPAGARQSRSQNRRIACATAAGASRCGKCPTPSSNCRA